MHAKWLTLYLKPIIKQFNHAYIPGHGALTASHQLINGVIHDEGVTDIYEFDLVQFFPSVDNDQLNKELTKLGGT